MAGRRCTKITKTGAPCRGSCVRDDDACINHSVKHRATAQAGRAAGGRRRKKEKLLREANQLGPMRTPDDLQRVTDLVIFDLVALDNTVARNRALLHAVEVKRRLFESGSLEDRVAELERARGEEQIHADE